MIKHIRIILFVIVTIGLIALMLINKSLDYPSILIILGGLLNIVCVFSNGFRMPVRNLRLHKLKKTHRLLTKKTKFPYLADIFVVDIVGKEYTRRLAFSIGDILLVSGIILNIITLWR